MRYFYEEVGESKKANNLHMIEATTKELKIIRDALAEYVGRNKRKVLAKKLFKEIDNKFSIY